MLAEVAENWAYRWAGTHCWRTLKHGIDVIGRCEAPDRYL
jgi:hypothetical protein